MPLTTVAPSPGDVTQVSARRSLKRVALLVALGDLMVIVSSAVAAVALKFGWGNWRPSQVDHVTGSPWIDFGWLIPVWFVSLVAADCYSRRHFARGTDEFKCLLRGSVAAAAGVSVLAYLINYDMSRGYFLYTFAIGTATLLVERWLVRIQVSRARRQHRLMHRVAAYAGEHDLNDLARVLAKDPGLGYELVAAFTPGGHAPDGVARIEAETDPVDACRIWGADTLLISAGSGLGASNLRRVGWSLEDTEIDLIVLPSLIDVAGPRIHTRPVAGLPFMHIEPPQMQRSLRWGKALFDRATALALLILLLPLFAVLAVAIRVESPGPILFRHRRIGLNGREFDVWKFRSMRAEAASEHEALVAASGTGPLLFKQKSDPRVTRVGGLIRRYSLDELPQLLNVVLGEMSLVGPRPQVAEEVERYDADHHRRLLVRPGLTGLWQVSGRSNLTWDEAVRLDLYYVDNWSMMGDLAIIARTIRAVLRPDGAY